MITHIKNVDENKLEFVICGYSSEMIYHEFNSDENKLDAGKSLTFETAKSIFNFINQIDDIQNYSFQDIIPKNVLKFKTDEKYIIWETPEGIQDIIYKENLPIQSGKYFVPKMVWKLVNNRLSIWAIKKSVSSKKDKLFQAPFFNVNGTGGVCMGNAKFVDNGYDYLKIMKKVEAAFWNSVFTHTIQNELLNFNFVEWCNDPRLHLEDCSHLLIEKSTIIKDIL